MDGFPKSFTEMKNDADHFTHFQFIESADLFRRQRGIKLNGSGCSGWRLQNAQRNRNKHG